MKEKYKKIIKYSLTGFISLVLILAVIIALLPAISTWYLQSWLEEQQLSSSIENIDIDLFDGHVLIQDLKITDSEGKEKAHLNRLDVTVDIWALLDNKLIITSLFVDDAYVIINSEQPDHLQIGGVSIGQKTEQSDEINADETEKPFTILLGDFTLKKLRSCYAFHEQANPLLHSGCSAIDNISSKGAIELIIDKEKGAVLSTLSTPVKLNISGIDVQDSTHERKVLHLDAVKLGEVDIKGLNHIVLKNVSTTNVLALQIRGDEVDDAYLGRISDIAINEIVVLELGNINISELTISELVFDLVISEGGELNLVEILNQYSVQEKEESETDSSTSKANVTIKQVIVNGDSAISFTDESIKPVFNTRISSLNIKLENIDTTQPDTTIKHIIDMLVGKHGVITLQGESSQPGVALALSTAGKIQALDLVQLNPYIQNALGYNVTSGNLDSELEFKIKNNKFDALFKNKLHHFYLADLTEEQKKKIKTESGVPLPTALSLLRDKEGSIELELPISGDISNPEFSISDAIGQVVNKALTSAILYYYNPYGLLTLLVTSSVGEITSIEFQPVFFEANSSTLDDDSKAQLDKIITMLNERPEIRMVICGKAAHDDYWALYPEVKRPAPVVVVDEEEDASVAELPPLSEKDTQQLTDLATKRTMVVKDYISGASNESVASRLLECQILFDEKDVEPARTEIRI